MLLKLAKETGKRMQTACAYGFLTQVQYAQGRKKPGTKAGLESLGEDA